MSDPKLKPEEPEVLACKICMEEIPKDLAKREEGAEYVYHFCGQACFEKWGKQKPD
ncbi:MAG: DUF3330 domain-containing protein [Gammaproteobacteria bacterium]|nr:DUF3330 domain-containing protein [Gammaproteobacteria bacterium]MCF6229522.1 DUF3330 domain-containing protein [Gammaproteobacteria bacterium]